ncbi:MAG: winged helix-turn-helix domain-containing protein [Tannerellaceae bacterium]|nr:winged helix-turn-helix domain-containing protein [Tannerellaceae bacterium]
MKLHEAIIYVLRKKNTPMTTREIADEINKYNLYERGDKTDVPPSQISARIKSDTYAKYFIKDGKYITLAK